MSSEENNIQPNNSESAPKPDLSAVLSAEDLQNLAGFFDVLIEMDFEQKLSDEGVLHDHKK